MLTPLQYAKNLEVNQLIHIPQDPQVNILDLIDELLSDQFSDRNKFI